MKLFMLNRFFTLFFAFMLKISYVEIVLYILCTLKKWYIIKTTLLLYLCVFRLIKTMDFSVIVIDTASTGHTLRLLSFPSMMEKALGNILELKSTIGRYLSQIPMFFEPGFYLEDIVQKIVELLDYIKTFNQQLKNHVSNYIIFLKQSKLI